MTIRNITAAALATFLGLSMTIQANAMTDLTPTASVHKFDLGSEEVGGSGVEIDKDTGKSQNWVKVIQPFNELQLFEDTGDPDIAAVAVTFEVSDWSGKEFNIGWGALITWYDESGNWYGFEDFKGTSDYVINSNGEYTVVCDLGKFSLAHEQTYGINMLQALEMVVDGVEEGDKTVIEVKSARQYYNGEAIENAKLPDGTEIPIETAALTLDDESTADASSESDSSIATDSSAETADSSSQVESKADSSSASKADSSVSDSSKSDEDKSNMSIFIIISIGAVILITVVITIASRKK